MPSLPLLSFHFMFPQRLLILIIVWLFILILVQLRVANTYRVQRRTISVSNRWIGFARVPKRRRGRSVRRCSSLTWIFRIDLRRRGCLITIFTLSLIFLFLSSLRLIMLLLLLLPFLKAVMLLLILIFLLNGWAVSKDIAHNQREKSLHGIFFLSFKLQKLLIHYWDTSREPALLLGLKLGSDC